MEELFAGGQSRYGLSSFSRRQLQRDHIKLTESYAAAFENSFICRILVNYMRFARENFLEDFEKDMSDRLKESSSYRASDNGRITMDQRITFTNALIEEIKDFDFYKNNSFKKSLVITYILEKFTSLQHSQREKIYCYQQYKDISDAIEKENILIIVNSANKEFEVKPLRIEIDENSFSYYLIGFSREKGSIDEFECYPFKLSRIRKCRSNGKEYMLSIDEVRFANERMEQYGCAYISERLTGIENTVVRLTEWGYTNLFLKVVSHQRPIPISTPKPIQIGEDRFFDLEFNCSYAQIRNYFFSFGSEAEIMFPEKLRKQFIDNYEKALKMYHETDDQNI